MKQKLTLADVCQILISRKIITPQLKSTVLGKEREQRRQLKKVFEAGKESGDAVPSREIIPSDIITSLHVIDARSGTEPVTEETVMRAISDALGVPFKKIDPLELDIEVVTKTVSKAFAIKSLAVPIAVENGELVVAMVDPLDREVIEDIQTAQKLKVSPVVSTKADIVKLIREFYGFKQSVVKAERELVTPFSDVGNLEQYARVGTAAELETTDTYVKNAVDYLFSHAFEQRASDIHIEPKREQSVVRIRIDGVLHTTYSMPMVVHNAVISRIKSISRLNIAEKRRPQDGRIKLQHEGKDVEIRVSTVPVAFGEKVVMRVLNPDILFQDLAELGFPAPELGRYEGFLKQTHGIILVTGPTGSGKTTTLYSSLKGLATAEKNITTVEDPIEMVTEAYNQIAVQPTIDITFASILRNILRQDPDIIMIGEIRDHETARNAIQAALTGHLVLSTLHTNDAASAVTRLIDLEVEPFLISSTLIGVMAQRLVRTICPHCEEDDQMTREEFVKLGLTLPPSCSEDVLRLKRGAGCRQCRQTGYMGREGIFEVLGVSEAVKSLITAKEDSDRIKRVACSEGMTLMQDNAVEKVLQGHTTYQEVLRCISLAT
ncbi:MAG: Flp pilus assembly complex ATPase component [Deltaproteobacteria bacterium]|nr:Flp pilus assembly complex ATPase component [Deltaproteobacteria bacterium]